MCILLGILEISRKHYFYLVEREDEKEAAKQAIRKSTKSFNIFSTKRRKFQSKIVETKKRTHVSWNNERHSCKVGSEAQSIKQIWFRRFSEKIIKKILKIVHKLIANEQWQKSCSCLWANNWNNKHGAVFSRFFQDRRSWFSVSAFSLKLKVVAHRRPTTECEKNSYKH